MVSVNDNLTLDPWGLYGSLPGDWYDAQKMERPEAKTDPDLPWWEDLIRYGGKRLIDNAVGSTPVVTGNTDTGSFAGQNGQTYSQDYALRGNANAISASAAGINIGSNALMLLLAIGLGLFVITQGDN